MDYIFEYNSPIGKMTLSSDGENLTGLWIENQKYFQSTLGAEYEKKELTVFKNVIDWLDSYFAGEKPDVNFSLKPKGSDFRQMVWQKLMKVPYGETVTYGAIAKELEKETGRRMSAQAVGGAIGHIRYLLSIPAIELLALTAV